jgi:hypothetical protein
MTVKRRLLKDDPCGRPRSVSFSEDLITQLSLTSCTNWCLSDKIGR